MIADIDGSLEASTQKLTAIYDDWWRRWRMHRGDQMLASKTEFARTNPIRYGAVLFSVSDIASLFDDRPILVVNINGTALAAGLLAYSKLTGSYPNDHEKIYGQNARSRSDVDFYENNYGKFLYRKVNEPTAVAAPAGRIMLNGGILYSRGIDLADDSAASHSPDGLTGDIVVWPPITALAREQGLAP